MEHTATNLRWAAVATAVERFGRRNRLERLNTRHQLDREHRDHQFNELLPLAKSLQAPRPAGGGVRRQKKSGEIGTSPQTSALGHPQQV